MTDNNLRQNHVGTSRGSTATPIASAISEIKKAYANPPLEITRIVTLTGDGAAQYFLAETLLKVTLGFDNDTAAQFLLRSGALREIQRFGGVMSGRQADSDMAQADIKRDTSHEA